MKLNKGKQFIADAINESGKGWADGFEYAAQSLNGNIYHYKKIPKLLAGSGRYITGSGESWDVICTAAKIKTWNKTVLSREEYFSAYPAEPLVVTDSWIEWNGGECPVEKGTLVDVKYDNGKIRMGMAALIPTEDLYGVTNLFWKKCDSPGDIVAYRMHKPRVKPVARSTPKPEAKPTIEQLARDYRNRLNYANRKQKEADIAKAMANAKMLELERAGEAIGMVISVAKLE